MKNLDGDKESALTAGVVFTGFFEIVAGLVLLFSGYLTLGIAALLLGALQVGWALKYGDDSN